MVECRLSSRPIIPGPFINKADRLQNGTVHESLAKMVVFGAMIWYSMKAYGQDFKYFCGLCRHPLEQPGDNGVGDLWIRR